MIINQPNMAVQEDHLATLFAKNMTLVQQQQQQQPTPQDDKIVYISQHYTHSAHVTTQEPPPPDEHMQQQQQHQQRRPSSEPPRSDLQDLELLLRSHGVDTSALTHPQVELFRGAGEAQQLRLVQLWSICPPPPQRDNPALTWANTTLEQEEMLARRRFELQQQQPGEQGQQEEEVDMDVPVADDDAAAMSMSLDGAETGTEATLGSSPASTSMQSADGSWPPPSSQQYHYHQHMEPYMASGYEELARKEYDGSARRAEEYRAATDPVYEGPGRVLDWERQQWMENRYGSIMAWRDDEEML